MDDSPTIRRVATSVLQQHGYRVLTADNGGSGFELALRERPDLILLDVRMPGLDGYETTLKKAMALSHGFDAGRTRSDGRIAQFRSKRRWPETRDAGLRWSRKKSSGWRNEPTPRRTTSRRSSRRFRPNRPKRWKSPRVKWSPGLSLLRRRERPSVKSNRCPSDLPSSSPRFPQPRRNKHAVRKPCDSR